LKAPYSLLQRKKSKLQETGGNLSLLMEFKSYPPALGYKLGLCYKGKAIALLQKKEGIEREISPETCESALDHGSEHEITLLVQYKFWH
jgi:hypothetical protein